MTSSSHDVDPSGAIVTEVSESHDLGGRSPLRIVVIGPAGMRSIALPRTGTVEIGRDPKAAICIDETKVSRRHARLHMGAVTFLEDVGSRNGTRWRGIVLRAGERVALEAGDSVALGSSHLLVHAEVDDLAVSNVQPGVVLMDERMKRLYAVAERLARGAINVLVRGETGVGKELLAAHVHHHSRRGKERFFAVNCAAFTETLLESELFGHEKGAFTGALVTKPGLFEIASGGTIFLDEVGETSLAVQAKLLRALETRQVTRIGGRSPIPVDVRIVSATNRDLEEEIAAKRFRQDLFFRLNGVTLTVPPLRERPSDIEPLAHALLCSVSRALGQPPPRLTAAAVARLHAHSWPGNVRELRNVMERALLLSETGLIDAGDLSFDAQPTPSSPSLAPHGPVSLRDRLAAVEKQAIVDALASCGGNKKRAAETLGIPRTTFFARLRELGLS